MLALKQKQIQSFGGSLFEDAHTHTHTWQCFQFVSTQFPLLSMFRRHSRRDLQVDQEARVEGLSLVAFWSYLPPTLPIIAGLLLGFLLCDGGA